MCVESIERKNKKRMRLNEKSDSKCTLYFAIRINTPFLSTGEWVPYHFHFISFLQNLSALSLSLSVSFNPIVGICYWAMMRIQSNLSTLACVLVFPISVTIIIIVMSCGALFLCTTIECVKPLRPTKNSETKWNCNTNLIFCAQQTNFKNDLWPLMSFVLVRCHFNFFIKLFPCTMYVGASALCHLIKIDRHQVSLSFFSVAAVQFHQHKVFFSLLRVNCRLLVISQRNFMFAHFIEKYFSNIPLIRFSCTRTNFYLRFTLAFWCSMHNPSDIQYNILGSKLIDLRQLSASRIFVCLFNGFVVWRCGNGGIGWLTNVARIDTYNACISVNKIPVLPFIY